MDLIFEMQFWNKHIKSLIIVILAITIIILGFTYYNERRSQPEKKGEELLPFPPQNMDGVAQHQIQGRILQYAGNRDGDIDKILIEASGNRLWLHFPPHTAKQVLSIAKINSIVSIEYKERPGMRDEMGKELRTITNASGSFDVENILPPAPKAGNEITITGSTIEFKQDGNGRITSFVLSGKLISLPPHAADNLMPLLEKAKTITVKGIQRNHNDGFVNINGLTLVRPDEIKIDSINYLVK